MELKLKDGSKDIQVTEEQYKTMLTTIRRRYFPTVTPERAEKAEAAVFLGEVRFFLQGNFTVVVLFTGGKYFVGATKRNKKDRSKPIFGKMMALSRAIREALHHYLREFAEEPTRKVMAQPVPVQDIPRTFEDVARAIVYPVGSGG